MGPERDPHTGAEGGRSSGERSAVQFIREVLDRRGPRPREALIPYPLSLCEGVGHGVETAAASEGCDRNWRGAPG